MASALKAFLWTAFFGIIAFFIHYETSTVTIKLREETYIKAKREEVYAILADVQKSSKFQPLVSDVQDVKRMFNSLEIEEITYTVSEQISVWDLYNTTITFPASMKLTIPFEKITIDCVVSGGLLLLHSEWFFTDADDKGFMLTEVVTIHTLQLFASYTEETAKMAHKRLLQNLEKYSENLHLSHDQI